jgi:EAL domain-containing protein (putative c-di-GMP-specific phosphodiesterase class I)
VNTLKIDRSFVNEIQQSKTSREIVSTIIQLANGLGIHVIAEGVETKTQTEILGNLGCDLLQGYYFGRPQEAADISRLIAHAP